MLSKLKSLNEKQQSFVDLDNQGNRYSNVNLNANNKSLNVPNVQSKSKSNNYDKSFGKTSSSSTRKVFFNYGKAAKDDDKNRWKKDASNTTSSTLSIHIATYENSYEAYNDPVNKNVERTKKKGKSLIQKWATTNIQNPFDFPRQQKEDQVADPEVMPFKASTRLLNPKQKMFDVTKNLTEEQLIELLLEMPVDVKLAQYVCEMVREPEFMKYRERKTSTDSES